MVAAHEYFVWAEQEPLRDPWVQQVAEKTLIKRCYPVGMKDQIIYQNMLTQILASKLCSSGKPNTEISEVT